MEKKFSKKYQARQEVLKALRKGILIKESCVICGEEKAEAHHKNYDRPLDVIWLCQKHHKETHKKTKEVTVMNSATLKLFQRHPGGAPRIYDNPGELAQEFDRYLDFCEKNDEVPCISGCCLFLGIGQSTFYDYENREEFSDTIERIRDTLEYILENNLLREKGNPVKWIFILKARFGLSETQSGSKGSKEIPTVIVHIQAPNKTEAIEDAKVIKDDGE